MFGSFRTNMGHYLEHATIWTGRVVVGNSHAINGTYHDLLTLDAHYFTLWHTEVVAAKKYLAHGSPPFIF